MKRSISGALKVVGLLLALSYTSFAQLQLPPKPQGMVSDFAGKLSPEAKQNIETLLKNFRERSGIEVAVVTIPHEDMQGYPPERYALELGRTWGVGSTSPIPAALLLVAVKERGSDGLHHGDTRLEVSRRLEGDIPDGLAGELIRRMRTDFQNGRFDQALTTGTRTLLATVADKRGISMEGIDQRDAYKQPVRAARRSRGISPSLIILGLFILFMIISSIGGGGGGRGGRRRRRGGSDWMLLPFIFGGGGGGGFGGYSGGSSWGGSGGGGDGGGFGGFGGGGDFGGGGAGDSW